MKRRPIIQRQPADALMILDIVEQVLLNTDNPVQAGKELSEILRELTGAKAVTIMLLDVDNDKYTHKMMVINPTRRKTEQLQETVSYMARQSVGLTEPYLWNEIDNNPMSAINQQLDQMEMDNTIIAPLVSAKKHVGCLLLLGLPEKDFGRNKVLSALKMFSSVLALTINNILLYENQEMIITARTAELRSTNHALKRENNERERAEKELRVLQNYLANIIDSMPSILIGVDVNCNVTLWNKTAEQATGKTAQDIQGQYLLDAFPPMHKHLEKVVESIKTRGIRKKQTLLVHTGDLNRYKDITIYPLGAEEVEGAVIRVDDVTERVRIEEMMIQNEKMLSVGGLAAGMAHEINNPLAGLLQTAQVLSNRLGTRCRIPANQEAAEAAGITMEGIEQFMTARGVPRMLNTITNSGQRMADIVHNMLSFARKDQAETSAHDLENILDKTIELAATDFNFKKQHDFKKIKIIKAYAHDIPTIFCQKNKIQQVLLNILRNGAQAMQTAGTPSPQFIFRTRLTPDKKKAIIEIKDNGPGMDEQTRKRIFEPFFTTKPVGEGTGLGLSVSYFIITENHKGEIAVESDPGRGAKFIISLPVI
nr:ATP-binding protein [uncultured Desulfobacter sp.]